MPPSIPSRVALKGYPAWAIARRAAWAFLKAIRPQASWSRARWFSSFFDQRIRIARLRLSHEWQASTTQRRARQPGRRALSSISSRLLRGRLGPLDRDRVERALQQLVVVAVGALVLEPDRDSLAFAEDRPLRPFLALSVGLGPVFGPPSGALLSAPSAASQAQSIPITAS